MQEDVAGLNSAGIARSYATCAECGAVFTRDSARAIPAGLNDDARSEFTELCPDCERLDSQGEMPVLGGPDGT